MRLALIAVALAGCANAPGTPPQPLDASVLAPNDLAVAHADLSATVMDLSTTPLDLSDSPDLWRCQPQIKPIGCGCPGLPCCTETINGQNHQFCAGANTVAPDPTQRCFDPGDPVCRTCGGFGDPCCFDGSPAKPSCRPGFECHQVNCAVVTDSHCLACDVAGCGLLPGAPCCTLPPYVCTNGMQCDNGVCR